MVSNPLLSYGRDRPSSAHKRNLRTGTRIDIRRTYNYTPYIAGTKFTLGAFFVLVLMWETKENVVFLCFVRT